MARTDEVAVEDSVVTGLEATYNAATDTPDGDGFLNDGDIIVHVKNGSGGDIVLTVPTPAKAGGMEIADQVITITAGEERFVGPFPTAYFNQTDGQVYLDWASVTSLTFALVRV